MLLVYFLQKQIALRMEFCGYNRTTQAFLKSLLCAAFSLMDEIWFFGPFSF